MEVFYSDGKTKKNCGNVSSNGVFSVPLQAVYQKPYEIFFKPRDKDYAPSEHSFNRTSKEQKDQSVDKIVSCLPNQANSPLFPINFYVSVSFDYSNEGNFIYQGL